MRRLFALHAAAAAALSMSVVPAAADRAAADACAERLSAESKLIYAATIGAVAPGTDLREVVRSKTRSLVMGGKLSRSQAQPAAEAAGACLKMAL